MSKQIAPQNRKVNIDQSESTTQQIALSSTGIDKSSNFSS